MQINKKIMLMYFLLVGISFLTGQDRSPPYEFYFQTRYISPTTTVTIRVQSTNSPRWDEFFWLASGTETVTRNLTGNIVDCYDGPYAIDKGGVYDDPSIGWSRHKVDITNAGMNAYFYIDSRGEQFQGDRYFTYNGEADQFYLGYNCTIYGTTPITNGSTIIVDDDNGSGNLLFQPTNPTNLSVVSYNNHPKLTWTASLPSFSDIKYKVYRKPALGSWAQIASNISSTSYIDYNINTSHAYKRTVYWYRVSAYTNKSSPGYSNEVNIYGYLDLKIADGADLTKIKDDLTEQVNINSFTIDGFPNPFNPIVTIQYSLPEKSTINVAIYNIEGRLIKTLTHGEQSPGIYKTTWDASDMPSGMYIAKLLSSNGAELSEKILLNK